MLNNYVPNSELAFIIGDGGLSLASPAPTKVAGQKVFSCLELQSTTRSDIYLKPKTDAQIAAIPNPTAGMIAFSSDSNALIVRDNANWNALVPTPPSPILYTTVTLDTIQIIQMLLNDLPQFGPEILPAPGPGLMNVIHGMLFNLIDIDADFFDTGGPGVAAYYGFDNGVQLDPASAIVPTDFFVGTSLNRAFYVTGNNTSTITPDNFSNRSITVIGVPPLSVGYASGNVSAKIDIWYSIIASI